MNIPRPVDSDLVALLHEITDDPARLLQTFTQRLRGTKHQLPRSSGLDEDGFFNQAERRMLRRHREELGELLYERCLAFMQETPITENMIDWRYDGIGLEPANRLFEDEYGRAVDQKLREILAVHARPISSDTILGAAELATRLNPSSRSRSLYVLSLKEADRFEEAMNVLSRMERQAYSRSLRQVVYANTSFVLCGKKEFGQALQYSRMAFSSDDSDVSQALSCVAMELCYGDRDGILDSSNALTGMPLSNVDGQAGQLLESFVSV